LDAIFEQWNLLEFSFQTIGIDLESVWHVKSWRWFKVHLRGLLASDTAIARYFAPEPAATTPEVPDE